MKVKVLYLFLLSIFFTAGSLLNNPSIVLAKEEDSTAYYYLNYQEPADVYLGKGGVFMVRSSYNAVAVINRFVPNYLYPGDDLKFYDRWIDFGIYDYNTNPYLKLYGFNYVYFNLKSNTRPLWDQGDLSIYHWDPVKSDWVMCETYLVEMKSLPHGRLSCIMLDFGLYGIATKKSYIQ